MKRQAKAYRNREKKIMKENNLTPVPLSGAGIDKEDGKSETIIAQLKSTAKDSYILKVSDLKILFENATITHKIPLFLIDFMEHNLLLCCFKKEDIAKKETLQEIADFIVQNKPPQTEIKPIEISNKTLADLF